MFPKSDLSIYSELNLNDPKESILNSNPAKKEEPKRTSELADADLTSEDRISSNSSSK